MLSSPSAERNKQYILEILKKEVPENFHKALEISSGTGQHIVLFANHFKNIQWQPTEVDKASLNSINQYITKENLKNVLPPVHQDVRDIPWRCVENQGSLDLIININMIHISEPACSEELFKGAGHALRSGGFLITYGPYMFSGKITPHSNVQFNQSLMNKNPLWGLRDIDWLKELGTKNGIVLINKHAMPANNFTLIWKKD